MVIEACLWVLPVVKGDVSTGVGANENRVTNLLDIDATKASFFAIDVHINGRVIKRLLELDIAEAWDSLHFFSHLHCMGPHIRQAVSIDDNFERSRGTKAHHIGNHVTRFESKSEVGAVYLGLIGWNPFGFHDFSHPSGNFDGEHLAHFLAESR